MQNIKMNQPRIIGILPKIGIRPVIDGRKEVREPLEDQTKKMAKVAAELLTKSLRHPNGSPVECVISDTISNAAEAAKAEEKFQKENVGISLTVTPTWCYGAETMDMDPFRPKAIWGFNGTE
ncbi:MAG: L-fucose isomerase, partial [Caldisericum sp.]